MMINATPCHLISVDSLIIVAGDIEMLGRSLVLLLMAVTLAACSQDNDATGSTNACAAKLFPSYNPKIMEHCVAACVRCDRGTVTTCSTSCSMKGAR